MKKEKAGKELILQDIRLMAIDVLTKNPEAKQKVSELVEDLPSEGRGATLKYLTEVYNGLEKLLPAQKDIFKETVDFVIKNRYRADIPSYSDKINSPTSLHWELYNFIIPKLPQTTTVGRARDIIALLEEEIRKEWVAWKISKMKVKK